MGLDGGFTSMLGSSWVQLEGLFQPKMARELSQINESLIDYEPESGVRSLAAHHFTRV